MAHNYLLQVSTGTEYDVTKHKIVPVNSAAPVKIESELMSAEVNVRIQVCNPHLELCPPSFEAITQIRTSC